MNLEEEKEQLSLKEKVGLTVFTAIMVAHSARVHVDMKADMVNIAMRMLADYAIYELCAYQSKNEELCELRAGDLLHLNVDQAIKSFEEGRRRLENMTALLTDQKPGVDRVLAALERTDGMLGMFMRRHDGSPLEIVIAQRAENKQLLGGDKEKSES